MRCAALLGHAKWATRPPRSNDAPAVRCGLPIEGYGPCNECHGPKWGTQHDSDEDWHDYQPSQWRHVARNSQGKIVVEPGHAATPPEGRGQ